MMQAIILLFVSLSPIYCNYQSYLNQSPLGLEYLPRNPIQLLTADHTTESALVRDPVQSAAILSRYRLRRHLSTLPTLRRRSHHWLHRSVRLSDFHRRTGHRLPCLVRSRTVSLVPGLSGESI